MFRGNISRRSSEILIHMSLPHHLIRKDIISSGVIGRGGGACLDQRLHNIKEKWKQRTNKRGLSPNFSLIPITPSTKQRLLKHGEGDRTRHLVMFLLVSYRHKKKQIFMICYRDFTSETPGKCLLSSRVKKKKKEKKFSKSSACTHLIITAFPLKFTHADDNAGTHTCHLSCL